MSPYSLAKTSVKSATWAYKCWMSEGSWERKNLLQHIKYGENQRNKNICIVIPNLDMRSLNSIMLRKIFRKS